MAAFGFDKSSIPIRPLLFVIYTYSELLSRPFGSQDLKEYSGQSPN